MLQLRNGSAKLKIRSLWVLSSWLTLGLGSKHSQTLAVKWIWISNPPNHNKQTCFKRFPTTTMSEGLPKGPFLRRMDVLHFRISHHSVLPKREEAGSSSSLPKSLPQNRPTPEVRHAPPPQLFLRLPSVPKEKTKSKMDGSWLAYAPQKGCAGVKLRIEWVCSAQAQPRTA